MVAGRVEQASYPGKWALVEPVNKQSGKLDVLVGCTVVDTEADMVPLRMYNGGSEAVTLYKGTSAGIRHQVQRVQSFPDNDTDQARVSAVHNQEPVVIQKTDADEVPPHLVDLYIRSTAGRATGV